jgi:hypothetical protein
MAGPSKWYLEHRLWVEGFVLVNLAFLALDIYLAHSVNEFRHDAEYVPLYFSLAAPVVLLVGLVVGRWWGYVSVWRDLGHLVGWLAVGVGLVGVILHLDSRFFDERTLKSLVYAAPFAAPLAYTGLGLLLLMNRLVDPESPEWGYWVLLLALGGFVGNFIFSVTDHAQNAFYYPSEWAPVISSAFAVGFLVVPFVTPVGRRFLWLCAGVLGVQAVVGVVGFWLHTAANLKGPSPLWFDNFVHGAPALAPLLFPNLVLLALIGLWVLRRHLPAADPARSPAPATGLPAAEGISPDGAGGRQV